MEIYKITNIINNKVYIGKNVTCDKNYYGSGTHIKNAIKKYGKNNFIKEIIEVCDDYNDLSIKEKYWIKYYQNLGLLYNLTEGGDGGDTWTNNPNIEKLKSKFFRPIIIDGVDYQSITEASKILNLERSLIRSRLVSFNFKNYLYKDNNINVENNKFINKKKVKKISINDVIYNSIGDACEKLKKPDYYILWRLQSKSYDKWFYITKSKTNKIIDTGPIKIKAVSINGVTYESIADAVRKTGINREIMRHRLKSNNYNNYYYL